MVYEKVKLLIRRLFWTIALCIGVIIPVALGVSQSSAQIIDDSGYLSEYYESLDESMCEIEVVCDSKDCSSGYVTVAFYDENGDFLSSQEEYFYGDDGVLSATFFVDGKVDSYAIVEYSLEADQTMIALFVLADIFIFIILLSALLLSCKVYEYEGHTIVVYAGRFHHYIKIDGVKTDEHNTLLRFTAIHLSSTADDGTNYQATISLFNRIALKINNKLYTKKRKRK